jgi:hypothetical protein
MQESRKKAFCSLLYSPAAPALARRVASLILIIWIKQKKQDKSLSCFKKQSEDATKGQGYDVFSFPIIPVFHHSNIPASIFIWPIY